MPRRELLTSAERVQLFAFPNDPSELIRLTSLSPSDLAFVQQHRGDHNRLGVAVLMSYLRYPGRVLGEGEKPYEPVLRLLAEQLRIPAAAWDSYAERDETRREHLLELLPRLGMTPFSAPQYRALSEWLEPIALQTTRGMLLAQAAIEELRRRLIVLPPLGVIERLCAVAATRAQRRIFALLTGDLTAQQKLQLDELLEMREGSSYSTLAWLRWPPSAPSARAILAHIERLQAVRALQIPADASRRVPSNRLLQIAREAAQTAVYQLQEYEPDRRYATLAALMIETAATLTDETLDLQDRLIGSFFTKSKNKYERAFAEQGKAINEKVRLYAQVGSALVTAREQGRDPYAAIESVVSWETFSRSVNEAEQLARDEDFDALSQITEHYSQLRRFAPTLLDAFEFRPAPVARDLLDAVDLLRRMNREGLRKVPLEAPTGFIRKKWAQYVFSSEGIDRRFYELCVMAELKNALRSGDVSVSGSRQFRDFEDYLIPRSEFEQKTAQNGLHDATHVLDGLLYHESDLRIEEHYTDTAGFTDHVFALCHLLGFRFAPRIRDLADKRLYVPGPVSQWPALTPLMGASLNTKLIEQQLGEVLRLTESIQQGTVTASLILRKLGSYPRQNSLALALREVGRIERTLFMLEWLRDPGLRRRVTAGLNKGEAHNALARAVCFHRLGEIRDRSFENQRHRASGLNLLVAAITLWNTVYLERAAELLAKSRSFDPAWLAHVSPLGWGHINLNGDYTWHHNKRVAKGGFRPLRVPKNGCGAP